jgi:hypothetical protein
MNMRKLLGVTITTTLLALICVIAAAPAIAQTTTPALDSEANLDTQLYLIVGTNQDVDDSRMPASLDAVIKQLRAALPFKNYRLAATLVNRVKNDGRLDLRWIGGPFASPSGAASSVTPSFSEFKVASVKLIRNADGQPVVQMLRFSFGARIPIQTGMQAAASGAGGFPVMNYENTGINTDISLREGEPVVVGTLNAGPSGDAIILVVSAKRTSR